MKNYNFRPIFHNFTENCVKNVSNFWRKFGKNLEVFIYRGFAFGARDFIKNGNIVFLEILHKLSKKI